MRRSTAVDGADGGGVASARDQPRGIRALQIVDGEQRVLAGVAVRARPVEDVGLRGPGEDALIGARGEQGGARA